MNSRKPKISRKRLMIFSVFVVISAIFWFLSAMNRTYTTKIDYNVKFIDFPEDLRPTSSVPEKLLVTVKAYGYDLIGQTGNSHHPLEISIKKYAVKDKNDKSKLILSTQLLSNKFFPDAEGINIVAVDPEKIFFKVEKLSTKEVPVKANIDFSCEALYMQSDKIKIIPDSVIVSGTEKTIKRILFAETEAMKFPNLNDTLKTVAKIKPVNNVRFSANKVKIIIPVEKYTENSVSIPLQVKNCPDSLKIITFPDEITVTYKVVLSQFKFVNTKDIKLSVDYNDIKNKHAKKLKVNIDSYPEFIKSVQISPEFIEYIIEKKQE